MLGLFIFALIVIAAGVLGLVIGFFIKARVIAWITGGVLVLVGLILLAVSTYWSNGVGEGKVAVNAFDRSVQYTITSPGSGFRAPWIEFVDFDLFSQEALYAGEPGSAPEYSGGEVNGAEITVSVGGINGGSTSADVDLAVIYNIDPAAITGIYEKYRSQEQFTKQIIERQILAISRQVPSGYTATEFRGIDRQKATDAIQEQLTAALTSYGVDVQLVTIQDIRYSEAVEQALNDVEVANQKQQTAEANLAAAKIDAQQQVVEAQAEADSNAILSASLTPEILKQHYLDALQAAAAEGNLIITDGSGSQVLVQR